MIVDRVSLYSMPTFIDELRSALPDLRVLTDSADTDAFRFDETAFLKAGQPLGVVFPANTAEVQPIVRTAAAARRTDRGGAPEQVCRAVPSRSMAR